MNIQDLQNWMFQNSLEDQWWVAVDDVTQGELKSLHQVQEICAANPKAKVKVLHSSQAQLDNPPWIEFELPVSRYCTAKDHHSYGTITAVSVLLPIIGLIVGIAYLTKDRPVDKKLGEHAIAVSILFMFIWYWVGAFLF